MVGCCGAGGPSPDPEPDPGLCPGADYGSNSASYPTPDGGFDPGPALSSGFAIGWICVEAPMAYVLGFVFI